MGADEACCAGDKDDVAAGAGAGAGGAEDAVLPVGAAPQNAERGIGGRGRGAVEEEEVEQGEGEECPKEELGEGKMVSASVNVDGFVHDENFLGKITRKAQCNGME